MMANEQLRGQVMPNIALHEDITREDEVIGSSDRAFGLTFAVIGALIGGVKLWLSASASAGWWFAGASVFLVLALFWTKPLAPLNWLWLKIAILLYKIVNPVVMALLFLTTIVPIGLLMRAFRKDLLRLRRDPAATSYWIARNPPGPAPESMKHQF